MVSLLDSDPGKGAMLLERILPGDSLLPVEDDAAAARILAETMVRVRTPVPAGHDFPNVRDWARGFERLRGRHGGGTGPMPEELIEEAEEIFARLLVTTTGEHLLHGDLHHDNVLRAGDGSWTAIDPKGVVGDAAYEPAAMLHNPEELAGRRDLRRILQTRLDIVCEVTGYKRQRVLDWAKAQAILASVWTGEDHSIVWEEALVFARALREIA